MNKNSPNERRLFLVPRAPLPPRPAAKPRPRLADVASHALTPLTLLFLAVLLVAGYLCLFGNWDRTKDFLTIFLPPISALLGAALRSRS